DNAQVDCCFTYRFMNFFFRDRVRIFEEFLHQSIIILCYSFYKLSAVLVSFVQHISRNVAFNISHTLSRIIPNKRFHRNQIYHTFEVIFSTDRQLQRHSLSSKHITYLLYYHQEVSTDTIHLVYETKTWYTVTVSLAPYSF